MSAARTPDPLNEVTLPQTAFPHERDVLFATNEVTRGEFPERCRIDGLRIELPVEGFERSRISEVGELESPLDAALLSLDRRLGQEVFNELQVSGFRAGRFVEHFIQLRVRHRDLECRQVRLNSLTNLFLAGLFRRHSVRLRRRRGDTGSQCWAAA